MLQLPDRWYQMFNTHDGMELVTPCFVIDNIHGDGNGGAYYEVQAVKNVTRLVLKYSESLNC